MSERHRVWTPWISNLQLLESWHSTLKVWFSDWFGLGIFQVRYMLCDFFWGHIDVRLSQRENELTTKVSHWRAIYWGLLQEQRRHTAIYITVNPLGSWQAATPQVSPAQAISLVVVGILWKGGVSDDLLKASCVSQDNAFCDGWSFSSAWCGLEST